MRALVLAAFAMFPSAVLAEDHDDDSLFVAAGPGMSRSTDCSVSPARYGPLASTTTVFVDVIAVEPSGPAP